MCYEKKKSLLFDVVKNCQILPSKICYFNMISDSFLAEKWGTLEFAKS